jgi:tRNA threonylcarbamoyl adenosine modification protein YjeE
MITNRQMRDAMTSFDYTANGEAATQRLAYWLRPLIVAPTFISLVGDLGVGKTAFARAFVQAHCGAATLVPSPSFTLMQHYQADNVTLMHADLYRLGDADEVYELGLLEAMDEHICLVEWADKGGDILPMADLRIELSMVEGAPDSRHIKLSSNDPSCLQGLEKARQRDQQVEGFLATTPWSAHAAHRAPLAGDASTRRYDRLTQADGARAVLMDWQAGPDGAAHYDGKPYSQVVHLAEAAPAYLQINQWLQAHDLSVPNVLASDPEQGLVLLEDLGDTTLAALDKASDKTRDKTNDADLRPVFYAEAVANLVHLHAQDAADFLADYDGHVQAIESSLFLDWYLPWRGMEVAAEARADWMALWQGLGDSLLDGPKVTVLRDFHSPNLLWRHHRQARYRVGLIDVQDALAGHAAYDLVSLLQDARLDVGASQVEASYQAYINARLDGDADKARFARAYAIAGAQRNLKIAGIFVRLAQRDAKPAYLDHLPRVLAYIDQNLAHPALANVVAWLELHAKAFRA